MLTFAQNFTLAQGEGTYSMLGRKEKGNRAENLLAEIFLHKYANMTCFKLLESSYMK